MATVSTPGLCSASLALAHADVLVAAAVELAADVALPVAAGRGARDVDELLELEFELPHAAIRTAARAGSSTVERRRARSKAHNLHPGLPVRCCPGRPGRVRRRPGAGRAPTMMVVRPCIQFG